METAKIIIDFVFRTTGAIVITLICLNTLWKAFAPKEKDPTKGLVYGERSKKPFIVRLRKRLRL